MAPPGSPASSPAPERSSPPSFPPEPPQPPHLLIPRTKTTTTIPANILAPENLIALEGVIMEKGEEVDVSSCSLDKLIVSADTYKLPLLVRISDYSCTERSVLNISTREFRTVDCPDFKDAHCECSKGGWLLMNQVDTKDVNHHSVALYLLNPSTGVRLDLPKPGSSAGLFTFSIDSGTPDCVVHVDVRKCDSACVVILVTHPGDEAWEVHEFRGLEETTFIKAVAMVGKLVVCCASKAIVAYDLSSRQWAVAYNRNHGLYDGIAYYAESESGEIAKVFCYNPRFSSFNFARLDLRSMDWPWVDMSGLELENTGWFLGSRSFFTRGEGKKVYTLAPNVYGGPNQPDLETAKKVRYYQRPDGALDTESNFYFHQVRRLATINSFRLYVREVRRLETKGRFNVYVHNLEDDTTESLLPHPFNAKSCQWVHPDVLF